MSKSYVYVLHPCIKLYISLSFNCPSVSNRNKRLRQLKDEVEAELIEYKREMAVTTKGSATKELRILKTIIKSLEGDLMREKTKYQKASHKRNTENRRLLDEVSHICNK